MAYKIFFDIIATEVVSVLFLAAEIAEMLSHDMEKEGLRARTLTLKLKTATFEVLYQILYSFSSLESIFLLKLSKFAILRLGAGLLACRGTHVQARIY